MEIETPTLIHLDNMFLTNLWNRESGAHKSVLEWQTQGHIVAASAIAWMEFLCGDGQQRDATQRKYVGDMLKNQIIPFDAQDADEAAYLFNIFGRSKTRHKKIRMDSLIAACAIRMNAKLATEDPDFKCFERLRLQLIQIPYH